VPRDESDPANDVLGNPLDYTGTVPKYATPVDAPCLTFDGTSQNPITLQSSWDYSGDFSLSAWFKSDNAAVEYYLFGHPTLTTRCLQVSTSGEIELFAGGTSDGVNAIRSGWENAFTHQSLNHVVLVWNSQTSQATLYVNGVSFGTQDLTTPIATGSITYNGRRTTDRNAGLTFDCRVYDYALTAEQVFNLPDNTILWLPLSEGDGNTVYDVANGDSYTITGYASTMWDNKQDLFFYSFENGCRVDSGVAIPALADGSAAADGNPLTGLPGLLNSDTYDLNLLPEPDAPYQRSAIPGATFDGVGDGVAVPTIFWDVNEDWEISTECILPDTSDMGIVGCIRTAPEFGLSLVFFSGNYIVRLKLGGYTNGVNLFSPTVNMFTPPEWASIHCLYVAATGQVVMTVNGVEYSGTVSAPTNNPRTEYQRQIAVGGRLLTNALYQGTIRYVNVRVGQNKFEYDFRENNGLSHPRPIRQRKRRERLIVNSSLSQIFAPTALETAYTLGDGQNPTALRHR
jgi:hypothetical protein